ncbi:hypothetical protein DTO280E4_2464 [Paecilomyces variotii]|nr:hypothetical protein DTO207G8_7924 [Paecilomyces variotii]KAJ9363482.1 hypothetical protein DTO280E4_2464 [Paecilomyces variotii]
MVHHRAKANSERKISQQGTILDHIGHFTRRRTPFQPFGDISLQYLHIVTFSNNLPLHRLVKSMGQSTFVVMEASRYPIMTTPTSWRHSYRSSARSKVLVVHL